MNPSLSQILVAIITSIGGIVTIIIQRLSLVGTFGVLGLLAFTLTVDILVLVVANVWTLRDAAAESLKEPMLQHTCSGSDASFGPDSLHHPIRALESDPADFMSPSSSPPRLGGSASHPPSSLAALLQTRSKAFVLVKSPAVGYFRSGSPVCKVGDTIEEWQVIGYLDLLGIEVPVRSHMGGEIFGTLYREGGWVGYDDPLIAIIPSHRGINKKFPPEAM